VRDDAQAEGKGDDREETAHADGNELFPGLPAHGCISVARRRDQATNPSSAPLSEKSVLGSGTVTLTALPSKKKSQSMKVTETHDGMVTKRLRRAGGDAS
jgi:hypothetical protein